MSEKFRERISSGIPGFDEVTGGGLPTNRVHVLKGAPGSGKTVLASQLCFHAARRGSQVLYVTLLSELNAMILGNLNTFAFFVPSLVGRQLKYLSLSGTFRDRGLLGLLQDLATAIRQERPAVMVMDGFFPIATSDGPMLPASMFLQDLDALVSLAEATLILTDSTPARVNAPVHVLADGIIELEEALIGARTRRTLRVCKLRGGRHLSGLHTFSIDEGGVRVSPRLDTPGQEITPESPSGHDP
jgi:circadian clock protein KaiC